MPWIDIIWTDENEAHIIDGGMSMADVEHVIHHSVGGGVSRSSGRPFVVGYAPGGRGILVVYEEIDAITVYPITAYFLED
jgi:uncharacterized DUF497 family protein